MYHSWRVPALAESPTLPACLSLLTPCLHFLASRFLLEKKEISVDFEEIRTYLMLRHHWLFLLVLIWRLHILSLHRKLKLAVWWRHGVKSERHAGNVGDSANAGTRHEWYMGDSVERQKEQTRPHEQTNPDGRIRWERAGVPVYVPLEDRRGRHFLGRRCAHLHGECRSLLLGQYNGRNTELR
jgi:hypothetical protein